MEEEKKEPELEEEADPRDAKRSKLGWILFFSILAAAIIACIVVIVVLKP